MKSQPAIGEPQKQQTPLAAARQMHLDTRDFDEVAHAMRGWDAEFNQISRGPFRGVLDFWQWGGVQAYRVVADRVIQVHGRTAPDRYFFTLVTSGNVEAAWRGLHLKVGQLNINHPGAAIDHLSSAPYETLTLSVDAGEFHKTAALLYGVDLEAALQGKSVLAVHPSAFAGLEAAVGRVFLPGGPSPPRIRPGPAESNPHQSCLRRLLHAVVSANPILKEHGRSGNRLLLVRQAEEFMEAHLQGPVRLEDLCNEFDVSMRTLRYAFQDVYGQAPMVFFKTKRLNAIRHELKDARRTGATVNDIALGWGFEHTGNFAADYHRLFGELPSQTLRPRK